MVTENLLFLSNGYRKLHSAVDIRNRPVFALSVWPD